MTVTNYQEWIAYHGTAFGMRTQQDAEMMELWVQAFSKSGISVPELVEASEWMLTESAPRFREQHLDMIQKRISMNRIMARKEHLRIERSRDDFSTCSLCSGQGIVIVPHPSYVRLSTMEWVSPFPTAGVTCSCPAGARSADSAKQREAPMMSLSYYETRFPSWSDAMQQRDDARTAFEQARQHSKSLDSELGNVISRVIGRFEEVA